MSGLNYGEHPRSRITVHLADFQLQLNWLPAVEQTESGREKGQTSKKRSQYSSVRGSCESPRRLRNVAARKCVMYFIIVNIGDVRCVWISTIFTMSPRLRLISAGSPINRVSARFRADRLKCSRYGYISGNLYQARNQIELAINKAIYRVKSGTRERKMLECNDRFFFVRGQPDSFPFRARRFYLTATNWYTGEPLFAKLDFQSSGTRNKNKNFQTSVREIEREPRIRRISPHDRFGFICRANVSLKYPQNRLRS